MRFSISCMGCLIILVAVIIIPGGVIAGLWWRISSPPSDVDRYLSRTIPLSLEEARVFEKRLGEFLKRDVPGEFEFIIDEFEGTLYMAQSLAILNGGEQRADARVALRDDKVDIFWVKSYGKMGTLYFWVRVATKVKDGKVLVLLEKLKVGRLGILGASGLFKFLLFIVKLSGNQANAIDFPNHIYVKEVKVEDGIIEIKGLVR